MAHTTHTHTGFYLYITHSGIAIFLKNSTIFFFTMKTMLMTMWKKIHYRYLEAPNEEYSVFLFLFFLLFNLNHKISARAFNLFYTSIFLCMFFVCLCCIWKNGEYTKPNPSKSRYEGEEKKWKKERTSNDNWWKVKEFSQRKNRQIENKKIIFFAVRYCVCLYYENVILISLDSGF